MKNTFNIHNNFMVRSSILEPDFFFTQLDDNFHYGSTNYKLSYLLDLLKSYPFLQEVIATSSISLYYSINNISLNSKEKEKKNFIKGIFRYLNRASTRFTPFGVCAKVGIGSFASSGNQKLCSYNKKIKIERCVEADIEWINKVKRQLETDLAVLRNLDVVINEGIILKGDRVKLHHSCNSIEKSTGNYISTTISYNEVVKDVLTLAKKRTNFFDLCKDINSLYDEASIEIVEEFLQQLIEQQYLITELEIHNNEEYPLQYLNSVLKKYRVDKEITKKIDLILKKIEEYQNSPWDDGVDIYIQLINIMKSIAKSKNYIKVDIIEKERTLLDSSLKKQVSEVTEYLCDLAKLNNEDSKQILTTYHNKFLEKYGLDREVQILELLDEDLGIGAPDNYEYPPPMTNENNFVGLHNREIDKRVINLVNDTVLKQKFEIKLDELDLLANKKFSKNSHLPNSLDIYFHYYNEKLILSSNPYSLGAGSTMGRFVKYFKDYHKEWRNMVNCINNDSSEIWVEVHSLPINAHTANISRSPKRTKYEINIKNVVTKNAIIKLEDIFVVADHHRLYLKSKSLNKYIKPISSNMLNPSLTPNVNRLLLEIGYQDIGECFPYHFSNLKNLKLPFIPRITFKDIVLVPARWNIFNYEFTNLNSFELFSNEFLSIAKQKKIPKLVYMVRFDQKILFNIDNKAHLYEIYISLKKLSTSSSIEFEESFLYNEEKNIYNRELVFSLSKNSDTIVPKPILLEESSNIPKDWRYKEPFNEWLYIKIYVSQERANEFLTKYLKTFINSQNWYDKFFYMRYKDPKFHIRLRFKANPEVLKTTGLNEILKWFTNIKFSGIVNDFNFSTYEREIERYGGIRTIDYAETIFHIDSILNLNFLNIINKNDEIKIEDIYLFMIDKYMSIFNLSTNDKLKWLNNRVNHRDFLREFRINKNKLLNFNNLNFFNSLEVNDLEVLNHLLIEMEGNVSRLIDNIPHHNEQKIESVFSGLIDSFIHLSHNRLVGIDREHETKYLTIFRHTLHSLNEKSKYV
ncbi:lantibiotic dehydratase [Staphylococcus chromogenes]|uniref:lantibiotic dehydratase n=1 Tax=Staphylococcus chromogenes TaxID=46126 RepID=UPI00188F9424|nr:lantibiotic dehydratase [Staphylococcus chromogenes]